MGVKTARKTTRSISYFQKLMAHTYLARDRTRGLGWAFKRLNDEIMELRMAVEKGKKREISAESADVFAWLTSVSNLVEIDLESASYEKYGNGCSKCQQIPCSCPMKRG